MKHKHADLIYAWADGAEIQVFHIDRWEDCPSPAWRDAVTYRIKPEEKKPVVRWLWANKVGQDSWSLNGVFATEKEMEFCYYKPTIKLEWSRTEFPE